MSLLQARFQNAENKHKNVLESMKETLTIGYASLPTDFMAFYFFACQNRNSTYNWICTSTDWFHGILIFFVAKIGIAVYRIIWQYILTICKVILTKVTTHDMQTWRQGLTFHEKLYPSLSVEGWDPFPSPNIYRYGEQFRGRKKWVPGLDNDKIIEQFCQIDQKIFFQWKSNQAPTYNTPIN